MNYACFKKHLSVLFRLGSILLGQNKSFNAGFSSVRLRLGFVMLDRVIIDQNMDFQAGQSFIGSKTAVRSTNREKIHLARL